MSQQPRFINTPHAEAPVLTWEDENGVQQVRHGRRVDDGASVTVEQLIDQRVALLEQIERLKKADDELSSQIMHMLLESGQKQAFGSTGLGYSVTAGPTRYEFGKMAYAYLGDKGLLDYFTPDPKITKTKLDALLKEGVISYSDMAEIDKWMTTDQSPYTLRKVVDKANPNVF